MRVVFVHGACVQDGTWWWHRTARLLREQGVESVAAELPSCGEASAVGGLSEDIAAVRELLTASAEETVVVAHSYGGIVVAEAAVGVGSVRHVLLISSYLAEVGEGLSTFGGEGLAPFLVVDGAAGTLGVRPELLYDTFLQDCEPEITEAAVARLAWQNVQVVGQPVRASVFSQVATTYLVCGQDRGTPPERQREFARRASSVVELDAGHHRSCRSRPRCGTWCSASEECSEPPSQ